jgi:two-component system, LuxR family, response regulator FixJ
MVPIFADPAPVVGSGGGAAAIPVKAARESLMGEEIFYHSIFNRDRLVHIVDADPSTCEALSVLFRLEGFQTAFSVEVAAFYASLERRRPDIVVLNLRIGPEDGIAVLRRLKSMRSGVAVFMLANEPQVELAVRAMKAGAADVVTKPINTEHLIQSVLDALRQDVHLGAAEGGRRPVEVRGFSQLTPREREVLQLITNGQSNKEAGRELGISPRTIEVHRARVMEKLGARNTADLMRIVLTS